MQEIADLIEVGSTPAVYTVKFGALYVSDNYNHAQSHTNNHFTR